jgi:hypothetical protein
LVASLPRSGREVKVGGLALEETEQFVADVFRHFRESRRVVFRPITEAICGRPKQLNFSR